MVITHSLPAVGTNNVGGAAVEEAEAAEARHRFST